MTRDIENPFLYELPKLSPDELVLTFVGRRKLMRDLFGRLRQSGSAAIIGEPHLGKTSLLRYMTADAVWQGSLPPGPEGQQYVPVEINCHSIRPDEHPTDLWQDCLDGLRRSLTERNLGHNGLAFLENLSIEENHGLNTLFTRILPEQKMKLVLLLDEFDALLSHPNFIKSGFFGSLRSIAQLRAGLILVITSRLSTNAMNAQTSGSHPGGSPYFNTFQEFRLGQAPLLLNEVAQLIQRQTHNTGIVFSGKSIDDIHYFSGGHPFLMQFLAAALFDALSIGPDDEQTLLVEMGEIAEQRLESFTGDLWRDLKAVERLILFIMGLREVFGEEAFLQSRWSDNEIPLPCRPFLTELQLKGLIVDRRVKDKRGFALGLPWLARSIVLKGLTPLAEHDRVEDFIAAVGWSKPLSPEQRSLLVDLINQLPPLISHAGDFFAWQVARRRGEQGPLPMSNNVVSVSRPVAPLSVANVRRLLKQKLHHDSMLTAFINDYFLRVGQFITAGMNQEDKRTLLLQLEPLEEIVACLDEFTR